ncbi:hypothetical protein LSAT2_031873 [Lamellibrachia satsuma]|nr:hypothetical protein LSAT2_031873 [Lamellibrachia satsuma]
MTTILRQLHWLSIKRRIGYKILVLVHKALYEGTPEYLAALLHQNAGRRIAKVKVQSMTRPFSNNRRHDRDSTREGLAVTGVLAGVLAACRLDKLSIQLSQS